MDWFSSVWFQTSPSTVHLCDLSTPNTIQEKETVLVLVIHSRPVVDYYCEQQGHWILLSVCIQWNQQPRHFFKTTSKSLAKVCFAYFMHRLYHNNHWMTPLNHISGFSGNSHWNLIQSRHFIWLVPRLQLALFKSGNEPKPPQRGVFRKEMFPFVEVRHRSWLCLVSSDSVRCACHPRLSLIS